MSTIASNQGVSPMNTRKRHLSGRWVLFLGTWTVAFLQFKIRTLASLDARAMESKWHTKKRSLAALAGSSPSAKRSTTVELATVEEEAVASNATSNPSVTALPSAEASAESDDPEIVAILSGQDPVHDAPVASVVLELSPSDESGDGNDDEPIVNDWVTPNRGRCLGSVVVEDGVRLPCEEPTNGSSQLCHYCKRSMR